MTRAILVLSALLVTMSAQAEIKRYDNKILTLKPWLAVAGYGYNIKSVDTRAELQWEPNTRSSTGVDFYIHGWFGFGFGGLGELKSEDRVMKGDTNIVDYRFSWAFRSFQVVANYQSFKGFYLKNSEYVNPARTANDPYIQAPDMMSSNTSILFTWIMNPAKYSLEAATDQTVSQTSSGGSWLVGASASSATFSNTAPLVPAAVAGAFGGDAGVTSARFSTALLRGGYGYTACLTEYWFGTLQGMLGLGPQFAHYSDANGGRDDSRGVASTDLLMSLGYNGDDFLSGLSLDLNATNYRTASLEIPITIATLKLYVGTRF